MMEFAYLLFTILICATASVWSEECVYSDYRLPQHIRPENYDLRLKVDTVDYVYKGTVKILIGVDSLPHKFPGDVIVLHANKSLSIDDVQFNDLTSKSSSSLGQLLHKLSSVKSYCRDLENELLVITLNKELTTETRGELKVSFNAAISDDPNYRRGFYKNNDIKDDKETVIVNTHFEPAAARTAFPCFDEPSFKATFDMTLVYDSKLVALSNSPVEEQDTSGKLAATRFKRTPRMSTYLLAWALGPFEYIEQVLADGRLRIRAYTLPEKLKQAKFALETGVRAITMMEEFFDVPFAMEKIDMVALPDFVSGAMENWGLILYKDMQILYDQASAAAKIKGSVAKTVIHELAHQWFGNLVTMAWWNDLWLNEGFASWMQNYFTEKLYPEFEWEHNYIMDTQIEGLKADVDPSVHSIQVEDVGRDLSRLFNFLVYDKTAAVLRHIHDDYLGPERFREGVRKYIKEHLYGNTEASDLWDAFTETSGLPVDKLMKSWITQPGHPEVEVELSAKDRMLVMKQRRHFPGEPSEEQQSQASEQKWMIPLSVIFANDEGKVDTGKLIMTTEEMRLELPDWFNIDSSNNWVKLNAGFKGFYRVLYSRDLIMRLEKPCKSKALQTADRMNLLYDIFTDTLPKSLSKEDLVSVFRWFEEDYEGAILTMRYQIFVQLKKVVGASYDKELLDSLLDSYKRIHAKQGFKIESSEPSITDAEGLSDAFTALIVTGYEPLVEDALREFDRNGNRANINLHEAMYKAVGKFGSQEQIERLKQFHREAQHPAEVYYTRTGLLWVQGRA